ncbi:DUF1848 family protein [Desulfobotulus mexicanus]|uniref:DUF1848 domain-containing protein n=1 Tax=Desulfobotulus mexicanus TaxID=2586642 RepID=A0A5S5MFN3_9BACT|nr:DUF1848 family protein [Desulfobotulus mexicanus]TYT74523.1 DUF1848 domain-containing protein [Desulfobotulus mexicanus]
MGLRRILSASRRTDLPAFHLPWFHRGLEKGFFEVENPVSGRKFSVSARAEDVAAFVFWSKNYGPFLENKTGEKLRDMGMGACFQFTINTEMPLLEPGLPPLEERMKQMQELALRFGPHSVFWRWDPICHWRDAHGGIRHNLQDFSSIAKAAAKAGISSCTTSFLDLYPKVIRQGKSSGVFFFDPEPDHKRKIIERMAELLGQMDIRLFLCCEPELLTSCKPDNIFQAHCIPGTELKKAFGRLSLRKEKGQRKNCGCTHSTDIGSYRSQPCSHNCLYCYAR